MCGLTQDEVLAIAEHEHIPEIAAAALGQYLLTQDDGTEKISAMLRDDIRLAVTTLLMHGSYSWRYDISYQAIRKRAHVPDGRVPPVMRVRRGNWRSRPERQ